ncbi:MAG: hypothetical protein NZT61_02860 [Deltaproteobacteria bacterium]|nr:hypothetical protein [Deltaproteobacteria bacterium]
MEFFICSIYLIFSSLLFFSTDDNRRIGDYFNLTRGLTALQNGPIGRIYKEGNQLVFTVGSYKFFLKASDARIRSPSGSVNLYPSLYCSPASIYIDRCRYTVNIQCNLKKWC